MIRLRRRLAGQDEGSALIFVMLIAALVLILMGTASATLISNIRPTGESIQTGQALAAAEAGIEDFTAKINTNCSDTTSFQCSWANGQTSNSSVTNPATQTGTPVTNADGSQTSEAFYWKVLFATSGFARVSSTGQSLAANGSPAVTRTLVADVGATPSFNNFEYYTKYETFPSDFVNSFYEPRNIQITSSSNASGSSLSGAGTLQWNGTCDSTDPNNLNTCVPTGASSSEWSTNICDDLYYPTADGPGRGTDTAWSNSGRRPTTLEGAMGTDNTFAYYSENGTFTPTSGSAVPEMHNDVCDSSFEPNMIMNGPIYSQDAYLIDRGKDTGSSKNSMPIFNSYAYSMWNGIINGAQQALGVNGGYERPYPNTDGQISTTLTPQPVYTTDELNLPANADVAKAYATCTYTGPTRIQIKQNIAYVTSPGTSTSPAPAGPSYCYTSTGSFTNSGGTGVVDAQVPISSTLIYVANPSTSSHPAATASNPIFNLSSTIPVPAPAPLVSLLGSFTNNVYSATAACAASLNPVANRQDFDCEASGTPTGGHAPDVYGNILTKINADLNSGGLTQALFQSTLTADISAQFNSAELKTSASNPYYTVSVGVPSVSVNTPSAPTLSPADPFYQSTTSGGFTTTTLSAPVSINRIIPGKKPTSASILSGSVSVGLSAGTPLVTTKSWPWFGAQTGPNTYTDPNNDITQYYNGYGDAYVEGTLNGSMTIVAEHDIVATNDLLYNNTNLSTTTDGLALVADHDVRVYRPMTCTDNGTAGATTPGYCPDDLTGVYNTPLSWPLPTNYPSLKYTPDNAPSMTSTGQGLIYATIFTLRGCFMIDNFYRGGIGNSASVYGGLYQYHRGPTSLPYQGRPYQGSTTKMPGIVLTYTYDNMQAGQAANGGLRVPWIPRPVGRPTGSSRTWNVDSISTGT